MIERLKAMPEGHQKVRLYLFIFPLSQ